MERSPDSVHEVGFSIIIASDRNNPTQEIADIPVWLRSAIAGVLMFGGIACSRSTQLLAKNTDTENPWIMPIMPTQDPPSDNLHLQNLPNVEQTPGLFESNLSSAFGVFLAGLPELLVTSTSKLRAQTEINIHIPEYFKPAELMLQIDNQSVTFDSMNMAGSTVIFTAREKPWIAIKGPLELNQSNIGFFVLKTDASGNVSVIITDLQGKALKTLAVHDKNLRNRLTSLLEDWVKESKQYQKKSTLRNNDRTYGTLEELKRDLLNRTVRFTMKSRDKTNKEVTILCTAFPDTERTMITTGHCVNGSYGNLDLYSYDVQDSGFVRLKKRTFSPSKYHVLTTGSDLLSAVTFKEAVFDEQRTFTFQTMPLRDEQYCAGHFIGHGNDEKWVLNSGKIINIDSYPPLADIKYDIPQMQPGNSGGPIVNCRTGEVVSIVRTTNPTRTETQNLYMPPAALLELISQIYRYEGKH